MKSATSVEEVLAWIAATDDRHARVSDSECACGWTAIGDSTWDQHRPYFPLGDLPDIIPSNIGTLGSMERMSTTAAIEWLTECLDNAHDKAGDLWEALGAIAEDRVSGDVREFARKALEPEIETSNGR